MLKESNKSRMMLSGAVAAGVLALAGTVSNAQIAVTNIGTAMGVTASAPYGLNIYDQVVGTNNFGGAGNEAFVYNLSGGAYNNNITGQGFSYAYGINNNGVVVGTNGQTGLGFVYNTPSGQSTTINGYSGAGRNSSIFYGINNNGLAVGYGVQVYPSPAQVIRSATFDTTSGATGLALSNDVGSGFSGTTSYNGGTSVAPNSGAVAINDSGSFVALMAPSTASSSAIKDPVVATPLSGGNYSYLDLATGTTVVGNTSGPSSTTTPAFNGIFNQDPSAISKGATLGGSAGLGVGIDSAGDVAGTFTRSSVSGQNEGFYYFNGSSGVVLVDSPFHAGYYDVINGIQTVNGVTYIFGEGATGSGGTGYHGFFEPVGAGGPLGAAVDVSAYAPGYTITDITAMNPNGDFTVETLAGQALLLQNAVPEPTSLGLLAVGGFALLGRRRSRKA